MTQYFTVICDKDGNHVDQIDWTPEEIAADQAAARQFMPILSRIQAFLMLESLGVLTEAEAEAGIAGNSIPAGIAAAFDSALSGGLITAEQRKEYRIRFLGFQTVERLNPMLPLLTAAVPQLTDEDIDNAWLAFAAV